MKELDLILTNPEIGNYKVTKSSLNDSDSLKTLIHNFFSIGKKDDTLLFYYAGHGDLDRENNFCFITENTKKEKVHVRGISAKFVHSELKFCKAEKKILILDCCFSGKFGKIRGDMNKKITMELEGENQDKEENGKGLFIITSSSEIELSMELPTGSEDKFESPFSKNLIEGLRTGEADVNKDGNITCNEIFGYIRSKMIEKKQTPYISADSSGDIILCLNPKNKIGKINHQIHDFQSKLISIKKGKAGEFEYITFVTEALQQIFHSQLEIIRPKNIKNDIEIQNELLFRRLLVPGFFKDLVDIYNIEFSFVTVRCINNDVIKVEDVENISKTLYLPKGRFAFAIFRKNIREATVFERLKDFQIRKKEYIIILDDFDLLNLFKYSVKDQNDKINQYLTEKCEELLLD